MYAIVRSGGRQHKVAVGDILDIDLVSEGVGETINLQPLLLVDGGTVTSDAEALGKVSVTAEVLAETKGPKIRILKYKNKTGYKKRQGSTIHSFCEKILEENGHVGRQKPGA